MQQLVSPYIIQFIAAFRTSREFILGEFSQDNQGVHSWLGVHSARLHTRMGVDKNKYMMRTVELVSSRQYDIIPSLLAHLHKERQFLTHSFAGLNWYKLLHSRF